MTDHGSKVCVHMCPYCEHAIYGDRPGFFLWHFFFHLVVVFVFWPFGIIDEIRGKEAVKNPAENIIHKKKNKKGGIKRVNEDDIS